MELPPEDQDPTKLSEKGALFSEDPTPSDLATTSASTQPGPSTPHSEVIPVPMPPAQAQSVGVLPLPKPHVTTRNGPPYPGLKNRFSPP